MSVSQSIITVKSAKNILNLTRIPVNNMANNEDYLIFVIVLDLPWYIRAVRTHQYALVTAISFTRENVHFDCQKLFTINNNYLHNSGAPFECNFNNFPLNFYTILGLHIYEYYSNNSSTSKHTVLTSVNHFPSAVSLTHVPANRVTSAA